MKEAFDRTLNWSPVYRALKLTGAAKQSGKEFDRAMSKLLLGNATFGMMVAIASGQFGDNIKIVGSGPTDPKAQNIYQAWVLIDIQLILNKKDGSYVGYTFSRIDLNVCCFINGC